MFASSRAAAVSPGPLACNNGSNAHRGLDGSEDGTNLDQPTQPPVTEPGVVSPYQAGRSTGHVAHPRAAWPWHARAPPTDMPGTGGLESRLLGTCRERSRIPLIRDLRGEENSGVMQERGPRRECVAWAASVSLCRKHLMWKSTCRSGRRQPCPAHRCDCACPTEEGKKIKN